MSPVDTKILKYLRFLRNSLVVLLALVLVVAASSYALGVRERNRMETYPSFSTFFSPSGEYRMEFSMGDDYNWVRLYRRCAREVVADRRFSGELVPLDVSWFDEMVMAGQSDQAVISLPPGRWEKWAAKLP